MTAIPLRRLGHRQVSAVGLGGAPLGLRSPPLAEDAAIRTVHAALDAGVTLVDTADVYSPDLGSGYGETIVGAALRGWNGDPGGVVVATKGGKHWGSDGEVRVDARPSYLRTACEASLRALQVDVIDLYQLHEPDPGVPFEESIGALAELRDAGKVDQIGISNVDADQIRQACAITPIASVQNRLGPAHRQAGAEIGLCEQLGLAFLAWAPLAGVRPGSLDQVAHDRFAAVARRRDVSSAQVAIAWELSLSPTIIPIPGATRPSTIIDSLAGGTLELGADDLEILGGITG